MELTSMRRTTTALIVSTLVIVGIVASVLVTTILLGPSSEKDATAARDVAEALGASRLTMNLRPRTPDYGRYAIAPTRQQILAAETSAFNADEEVEIPFTRFTFDEGHAKLFFHPASLRSRLQFSDGRQLSFPRDGVPLKIVAPAVGIVAVFFREMFSGRLLLFVSVGEELREYHVSKSANSELMLRAATMHRGALIAVLYDNENKVNDVVRIDLAADGPRASYEILVTLPTLEDPAGTNYEMMPAVFLMPSAGILWIVGGTLVSQLGEQGLANIWRLKNCVRAQEAVPVGERIAVLCVTKPTAPSPFSVSMWTASGLERETPIGPEDGVPWRLSELNGEPKWNLATDVAQLTELLRHDLEGGPASGVMDLGRNNLEGTVAWSQIYFLNGLLDLLRLAASDNRAFDQFEPLYGAARRRLDIEIYLLDRLLQTPMGFLTKAFTVARAPSLFAVQTARLVLLFNRYQREVQTGVKLSIADDWRQRVLQLSEHIEVLSRAGPDTAELRPGRRYLAWPKGSAFFFDGLNVPFNHQNEWAGAVIDSVGGINDGDPLSGRVRAASEIINHFLDHVAPDGTMPANGKWPYWWGRAKQGWKESDSVSVNTARYAGDKSVAFVSFRTIDVMSVLKAERVSSRAANPKLVDSIATLVSDGLVYPFAAQSFARKGIYPRLKPAVALQFIRMSAAWDLRNAVWAHFGVPAAPQPEDLHSHRLSKLVHAAQPWLANVKPTDKRAGEALLAYLNIAIPYNADLAWRNAGLELGGMLLAWNLAYDLRAAVFAYQRTGDARFLDSFEAGFDVALRMRDDRFAIHDDARGRVMPAWGTNRFSPDKRAWIAWDVLAGMLLYPAVIYAHEVLPSPHLGVRHPVAERYLRAVRETVAAFEDSWHFDFETREGFYLDPLYRDVPPLNRMNLLGLVHVVLCTGFSDQSSCNKAAGLARFFRNRFKRNNDGTCEWDYWASAMNPKHHSSAAEDITHAFLNVEFAELAYRSNIVFDREDMACMGKTLQKKVMRPQGDWAAYLDGRGNLVGERLHEGLTGWAVLSPYAPEILPRIEEFVFANPEAYPLGWLSYATGPGSFALQLERP